jgi:L-fucose isomerase-like protein
MSARKCTFALFFGTRALFPASLIAAARRELSGALESWGHETLMLDENATRHGAVETPREAETYARFLHENRGRFDGVIVCLANFGDENGAAVALKDAGVPILIQAYPDEMDKLGPTRRRDAFCGKLSVMNVLGQCGAKFTALPPHTVSPDSDRFRENVEYFERVCRVVGGLRDLTIGAVGARTTPFKTVRIDEVALQRHGITVETIDLSMVFQRVKEVVPTDAAYRDKAEHLRGYTNWEGTPDAAFDNLVRLGVVLDALVAEYGFGAVGVRCWTEFQEQLGISPCVVMAMLSDRGIPAACEVDVGSAVAMRALALAADQPAALLDWNNNYGADDDKCILFHCSAVPAGLMTSPGRVADQLLIARVVGAGRAYGCKTGRLAPMAFTFGNLLTAEGRVRTYLGHGEITEDPIPEDFFGCGGVARIERLQDVLLYIGQSGHRHHVAISPGYVQEPLREALGRYLGFDVTIPQGGRA